MRLLTRSDFDGLICAVLLKHMGKMDQWQFVHPKDVQDGLVAVTADDILANVPYTRYFLAAIVLSRRDIPCAY